MLMVGLLSVGMGLVLGLLGGGGSILTVPIARYGAGMHAKEAIATSLVVVGATSLVGALAHARMGHVRWRIGLIFGAAGMAGAYVGGRSAFYVSGPTLLVGFAVVMVVAGIAMLRRRQARGAAKTQAPFRVFPVLIEGLIVGLVTGLVGAGGGFLVVPALVLFAGLPMHAAVGTSLLIIALKSFAGVAGHLAHVTIDPTLTLSLTAAAVAGALVGTALSTRVCPHRLRQAFALLVFGMAAFMLRREAPQEVVEAVLVARWPWWVVGLVVAGVVMRGLLLGNGPPETRPREAERASLGRTSRSVPGEV
jgi:uncharacterized membrane protein YfcA